MATAAAGVISKDEFKSLLANFVDTSDKINDGWHVEQRNGRVVYASKKSVILAHDPAPKETFHQETRATASLEAGTTAHSGLVEELEEEEVSFDFDEDCVDMPIDDQCCADTAPPAATLTYEYHVVYSESYQVPVLYFNVYRPDGNLLPLDQVWARSPPLYQDVLEHHKWTTLTQQEHPVLGQPFLQLHPCHTAQLMAQVHQCAQDTQNYLVSWLSTVGPLVGLHIPPEYVRQKSVG